MPKYRKKDYSEQLEVMQVELNNMARWLQATGKRILVIVEGRDTAGKGGVINTIAETLNPRQCRVVALPKPSERELGQWYFQRYLAHLPAAGSIALQGQVQPAHAVMLLAFGGQHDDWHIRKLTNALAG